LKENVKGPDCKFSPQGNYFATYHLMSLDRLI